MVKQSRNLRLRTRAGRWLGLPLSLLALLMTAVVWAPSAHAADPGGTRVIGVQTTNWTCDYASGCANQWWTVGVGDMNGDGHNDIVWFNKTTGQVGIWELDGAGHGIGTPVVDVLCSAASGCSKNWRPIGVADMNGDGHPDIVWFNEQYGMVWIWTLDSHAVVTTQQFVNWTCPISTCNWRLETVGDLNGDGYGDLVWTEQIPAYAFPLIGRIGEWLLNGSGTVMSGPVLDQRGCPGIPIDCENRNRIVGVADLNGDGHNDLTWEGPFGSSFHHWYLDGATHVLPPTVALVDTNCYSRTICTPNTLGVADMNGDHQPDIVTWNSNTGAITSLLLAPPA